MATPYTPWFVFSFLMRSYQDTMIAMLQESFITQPNIYSCQPMPWSSQVLPQDYAIGWWTVNKTKPERFFFPSALFANHYIFRNKLNLEQTFLISQLKGMLYNATDDENNSRLILANGQHYISEEHLNTYIRRVVDALFKLQEKFISSSLVSQQPTAKYSTSQDLVRDPSQERIYYGIQSPDTPRSFLRGKFLQKFLCAHGAGY